MDIYLIWINIDRDVVINDEDKKVEILKFIFFYLKIF